MRAERQKFTFCASVEICILVESFSFDLPAIAKPRNVICNIMKTALTTIFCILSSILFSQQKMNNKINKLFLNLSLEKNPTEIVKDTNLKFEYGENQGVEWTGGNTKIYTTKFEKNELIHSKILNGQLLIKQNEKEIEKEFYEIIQRLEFENQEDLLFEFTTLSSEFEKYGFKSKETITENEKFEVKSQINQIFLKSENNISNLTFGYSIPDKNGKTFVLIINYKNKLKPQ